VISDSDVPVFSVVIPSYNRINFLLRTLDSVWSQNFTDFEVIVVDDGSTDDTIKRLAALATPARLVTQANRGPGSARNIGANVARGKYIAFLDSDDLWFPWTLATFAELVHTHNAPSILSGKLMEFSSETELENIRAEPTSAEAFPDYFASAGAQYFVGAGMMVLRRDTFLESGGFIDGRLNCEDHDLILRIGSALGFVQILAPTTLGWRRHATSETADKRNTVQGIYRIVDREQCSVYPGGRARARERHEIITSHTRPASLTWLSSHMVTDAWRIYVTTIRWNLQLARWRYIALFPILLLLGVLRSKCGRGRERVHPR
jgi:cellulose synthase/poly-beta-1,6-N-acetylglucosamine synthase-like glycosyltransferase